jgi:hypothetical protein
VATGIAPFIFEFFPCLAAGIALSFSRWGLATSSAVRLWLPIGRGLYLQNRSVSLGRNAATVGPKD